MVPVVLIISEMSVNRTRKCVCVCRCMYTLKSTFISLVIFLEIHKFTSIPTIPIQHHNVIFSLQDFVVSSSTVRNLALIFFNRFMWSIPLYVTSLPPWPLPLPCVGIFLTLLWPGFSTQACCHTWMPTHCMWAPNPAPSFPLHRWKAGFSATMLWESWIE